MSARFACVLLLITLAGCGGPYDGVANLDSRGTQIICLGDSITRGLGATRGNDYPAQLSRLIRKPVINAGVSGNTVGQALRRIKRDVLGKNARVVIVELGGNDALRKVNQAETLKNLDMLVAACVKDGAIVVLLHAKFGIFSDPYLDGFQEVAERRGAYLVKNVLKGILGKPSLMSDRVHPNDAGYALLAERVAEALLPLLEAADQLRQGAA